MKKLLTILLFLASTLSLWAQRVNHQLPYVKSENSEPARSEFMTFRKASQAFAAIADSSQNYSSLEGNWVSTQKGGVLELSREFVVPFDYTDRALYMHLGATTGAMTLYINGVKVGSRTDSRIPSEFKISNYVERGLNNATVRIENLKEVANIELKAAGDAEGIIGRSYLFAQPKIRIFDLITRTTLDPTYKNGLLEIAMLLKTELVNPHEVTVYYDLYNPKGEFVNQEFKVVQVGMREQDTVRFTASILNVDKWSFETPGLYTVMFRVKREGRFTEYVTRKIGFRAIETTDQIRINGQSVKFQGVNADMFPKLMSRSTSSSELLAEITRLKRLGVNAIRTPYPLASEFYDICDSVGLYVVANANLNTGMASKSIMKGGTLANDPAWREAYVSRVVDNYEYLKVHPSIIAWGLGDNAGNGYNMYQAYNALAQRDVTRPIVYDGAGMEWNTAWYMPSFPNTPPVKPLQPTVYARAASAQVWSASPFGGFIGSTPKQIASFDDVQNGELAYVTITPTDLKKMTFAITNNLPNANLSQYNLAYKIFNAKGKLLNSGFLLLDAAPNGGETHIAIPKAAGNKKLELSIANFAYYSNR